MNAYERIARKYLSGKRLAHSMAVADEAARLARLYGCDEDKAYAVGAVHDIAKAIDKQEAILEARKYGVPLDEFMIANPALIHGPLGAAILRADEGVGDEAMLRAVSLHTTGGPDMGLLDKITYVADLTEPNRTYEGIDKIREDVKASLDDGMITALKYVMEYVLKRSLVLHPNSLCAYNQLIMNRR